MAVNLYSCPCACVRLCIVMLEENLLHVRTISSDMLPQLLQCRKVCLNECSLVHTARGFVS
jgi:hypothetical protein